MDSIMFPLVTIKLGDDDFKSQVLWHKEGHSHYDHAFQGSVGKTNCCGAACLYVPGAFAGYYESFEELILKVKKSVILLAVPYTRSVYVDGKYDRSKYVPMFPHYFNTFNEKYQGVVKMHYEAEITDGNHQYLLVLEQLDKDKYYNLFNIKDEEE